MRGQGRKPLVYSSIDNDDPDSETYKKIADSIIISQDTISADVVKEYSKTGKKVISGSLFSDPEIIDAAKQAITILESWKAYEITSLEANEQLDKVLILPT